MKAHGGGLRLTLAAPRSGVGAHGSARALRPRRALLRRSAIDASRIATEGKKAPGEKRRHILFALRGSRAPSQPGLRLMLAVLDNAIEILLEDPSRVRRDRERLVAETAAWVQSDDLSWVLSFWSVCEALEIDPLALRKRLAPWLADRRALHAGEPARGRAARSR